MRELWDIDISNKKLGDFFVELNKSVKLIIYKTLKFNPHTSHNNIHYTHFSLKTISWAGGST